MSDIKVNLRKIVGLEEEINKLAKQPDRARVLGDKGVHWLNGYGENGEEPTEEEKEEADKKDKGKAGSRDLDDKKDASEPLKIGDDAGDLGGLKDCKSGQCINVRLHGKAPPPDGWNSVCDPPTDPTYQYEYYYSYSFYKEEPFGTAGQKASGKVKTRGDVLSLLPSFFNPSVISGQTLFVDKVANEVLSKDIASVNAYVSLPSSPLVTYAYYSVQNTKMRCDAQFSPVCNEPPKTATWPKDQCSEVVAGSGGFKGACPTHDPNLPSQFGSAQNEITLCDKDGNEVKFTKTDEGYEVYQAKYRRTAVVDPNTFKVVRFK